MATDVGANRRSAHSGDGDSPLRRRGPARPCRPRLVSVKQLPWQSGHPCRTGPWESRARIAATSSSLLSIDCLSIIGTLAPLLPGWRQPRETAAVWQGSFPGSVTALGGLRLAANHDHRRSVGRAHQPPAIGEDDADAVDIDDLVIPGKFFFNRLHDLELLLSLDSMRSSGVA